MLSTDTEPNKIETEEPFLLAYASLRKEERRLKGYIHGRKAWTEDTVNEVIEEAFDAFVDKRTHIGAMEGITESKARGYFYGVLRRKMMLKGMELYEKGLLESGGFDAVLAYRKEMKKKSRITWREYLLSHPDKLEEYRAKQRAFAKAYREKKGKKPRAKVYNKSAKRLERQKEIQNMYDQGHSIKDIAKHFNRTYQAIWATLKSKTTDS